MYKTLFKYGKEKDFFFFFLNFWVFFNILIRLSHNPNIFLLRIRKHFGLSTNHIQNEVVCKVLLKWGDLIVF